MGAAVPLVILKKPARFTWPVMSVVADWSMASRMPVVRPPRRTSMAVTPAMADPSSTLRRVCRARFRAAMAMSVRIIIRPIAWPRAGVTRMARTAG